MTFSLRLSGFVAAPHTPFTADDQVDLNAVPLQATLLREGRISGVFIAGTTGETASLSVRERMALCEAWVNEVGKEMPVVVHVGSNSVTDARALARHAQQSGAQAIAALPPNYFKPTSISELAGFLGRIAEAAPDLPLYYYDIPHMTGVTLSAARLLEEGRKTVPNLHGIKFSNNDMTTLQECLALDDVDIVFGFDEILLCALALGVTGAIGATYNFAAPLYHRIAEAFEAGDTETARSLQRRSVTLVRTLQSFGFLRGSKAMMRLMGVDCGPPRSPSSPLGGDEISELADALIGMEGLTRPVWI